MTLLSEVIKYGKDIVLLGERVDALVVERREMPKRMEDHERRLIRIETLIEFSHAPSRAAEERSRIRHSESLRQMMTPVRS